MKIFEAIKEMFEIKETTPSYMKSFMLGWIVSMILVIGKLIESYCLN